MIGDYFNKLGAVLAKFEATDNKGENLFVDKACERAVSVVISRSRQGGRVFFIGNGGSASIANHISTDLLKNSGIPAVSFSDSSLLTCLSNDLGYEQVFKKPLELFCGSRDILFAISSSGKSKNILNAVRGAKKKKVFVVTLSGFARDNLLRRMGDINFYLPSDSYGFVEIAHLALCHCIADTLKS